MEYFDLIRTYMSPNFLYIFYFLHSIETLTDGNGTPLQSKKNFHSTDKSPFQRYYTKSGDDKNRKDVSQTRSSIRHFDMSSPLRLLRRSCPQSPQLPQSSIQQGTYVLMLYLKKQIIVKMKYISIPFSFRLIILAFVTVFATPPVPRRRFSPSPKPSRQSWIKRHLQRRPQTVNVDDTTLSGNSDFWSQAIYHPTTSSFKNSENIGMK